MGFLKTQLVAKYQKIEGELSKKISKKSHKAENGGGDFVSYVKSGVNERGTLCTNFRYNLLHSCNIIYFVKTVSFSVSPTSETKKMRNSRNVSAKLNQFQTISCSQWKGA